MTGLTKHLWSLGGGEVYTLSTTVSNEQAYIDLAIPDTGAILAITKLVVSPDSASEPCHFRVWDGSAATMSLKFVQSHGFMLKPLEFDFSWCPIMVPYPSTFQIIQTGAWDTGIVIRGYMI